MSHDSDLLEFPCSFPLKIMGRADAGLMERVRVIATEHLEHPQDMELSQRASRDGNFVSVTLTVTATSRKELDRIYGALSAADEVMMVL